MIEVHQQDWLDPKVGTPAFAVLAAVAVTSAMLFDQIRQEKAITDTIL